ncbi:MAG: hypothetical protein HY721_31360 [Planctomycetes bacterium]|nr:hypothetical protein [Planctomycetota bacterium]
MFLRRKRKPAETVPLPKHLGDLWHALQEIAREEDPRFAERSIVEHFNSCAEGARDVDRWLHIYQRRVDPSHAYSFPPHHRRHRGHVLVARNWPEGIRWDAFHETTWARVPLPRAPDAETLVRALDEMLDLQA